jgi:Dolichyl-phosphate-mannose-protein mannosyltransferase
MPPEIASNESLRELLIEVSTANSATQRRDIRNLLLCIVIVATALLLTWPFANIGYGDDTAYAHVALTLARTGYLLYNGWEAAFLVFHAYWGALFIRLFGFSFVCLRLSTLPFALGAVALCYLLMRRVGLQQLNAVLVTLLFGLSPLFLPVAVSYMTDVPAIFFMFASLYSFARAEESAGKSISYSWLVLGVITGFIGGTSRQVVWLVPVIVLPYLAWARHQETWLRRSAILAWVLVLRSVLSTIAWFSHQPYTVFQPPVLTELKIAMKRPFPVLNMTARLVLMILLIILPAAVPLLFRSFIETWRGPRSRQLLVAALLLLVLVGILIHPSLASIPWINSTLNWEGINGSTPLPGRPIVLIRPIRALVSIVVYVAASILAGELWNVRRLVRGAINTLRDSSGSSFTLAAMSLVSVAYFAFLIIRAGDFDIFDRYLLPVIPWTAAVFLLWFEKDNPQAERMLRRAMPFVWTVLVIFSFYAIASTQDLWALAKARGVATQKLEAAAIPRTAIDGGFDYNAWTQLMISGRLNSHWVVNPPGAYDANFSQTPSVVPLYRLEYALTPETAPSEFPSVAYFSILPPFHKQVRIDRLLTH